ncbi:SDR family NAD(P)-dependent oxidoreductase [Paeniroseomonas aquatica]|uniref:SDR family NAD(P)-dependent oxidoreductase n=1 Tax=Paeniroseomonas aquatica TaxID=373043 RepID=A0ABT8AC29_9PROT|nr:SDR family NAD(P)-dependent oxidoreductase [Paeniroseomonas aquatica]MDN3567382.1 SDR family NAD(P)-dependent oxidoreductase [Paeniroseomonas aquatica]
MRLQGRRAVITGGASGIGLASARVFLREGAQVVLLDRDEAALARAASELGVGGLPVDVADPASVAPAVAAAAAALGGLDAVVNAAGISRLAHFSETTAALWRSVMAVNLDGPFHVCSAALAHLRAAGGGSIVNLASAAGLVPRPNYSAYGASKGGLIMLTRTLALDLAAENIRVNAICPGAIATPMLAPTIADADEAAILARYAMRRFGTAEEVANLVLFLTSSEASYVTGAAYTVDGGSAFH